MNKKFAPNIAIWTNLYPNHLDRHMTQYDYFNAKFNLLKFQREQQTAILSAELLTDQNGLWFNVQFDEVKATVYICSSQSLDTTFLASINRSFFYFLSIENTDLVKTTVQDKRIIATEKLCSMQSLPGITFLQNWTLILCALHVMGTDLSYLNNILQTHQGLLLENHHHRLEHFATLKGTDFYDDSKSTVIQSTIAAYKKLATLGRPIILIVGGLGKGVDRSPLAKAIATFPLLKKVFCFGNDCASFGQCTICPNLETTVQQVAYLMQPGDIVLFSPSGTSFDFFKNYEHRGDVFKELVKKNII